MAVFTADGTMSLSDMAEAITIGGKAYGMALARHNGLGDYGALIPPAGTRIEIPDDWIGAVVQGDPRTRLSTQRIPGWSIALGILFLFALVLRH